MKTISLLTLCALALSACETTPPSSGVPDPPAYGETVILQATIVVQAGQTFDGKGTRYVADPVKLGNGGQSESQKPLFLLKGGATLRNVVLGYPGADGVRVEATTGRTLIEKCYWEDVGEDAVTVTGEGGTVLIRSCTFKKAADKVIQVNSPAPVLVEKCQFYDFGRAIRGCGTCGDQPYMITGTNLRAEHGGTVMKLTNPQARGSLSDSVVVNVGQVAEATNGASIKLSNIQRVGR